MNTTTVPGNLNGINSINNDKPFNLGDQLYNPGDGKSYNVKTDNPGGAVVVNEESTDQQMVINPQDRNKLIPQVKAWQVEPTNFNDLSNQEEGLVLLGTGGDINDWINGVTSLLYEEGISKSSDPKEVWSTYRQLTTSGGRKDLLLVWKPDVLDISKLSMWRLRFGDASWLSDYKTNYRNQHTGYVLAGEISDQIIGSINRMFDNSMPIVDKISGSYKSNRTFNNTSFLRRKRAKNMKSNWMDIRENIFKQDFSNTRKNRMISKNAKIDGREPVSGVPTREEKEIVVGLTEFPYGEEKGKGKGYEDYTMEELDNKQLKDREHFRNELLLNLPNMRRKDLKEYIQGIPDSFDNFDKEQRYASEVINEIIGEKSIVNRLKEAFIKSPEKIVSLGEYTSLDKSSSIDEIDKSFADEKTAVVENVYRDFIIKLAEEEKITEMPLQFKENKVAPGENMGYVEPEAIQPARGKVSEAITKMKTVQSEITKIKTELEEATKDIKKQLLDKEKPIKERLNKEQLSLNTFINMIYEQLSMTEDKVAHYEQEIYAVLNRDNIKVTPVSLTEVLAKAEEVSPLVAAEIKKIKAVIENDRTTRVLEKYLYQYPVKGPQKNKLVSYDINNSQVVDELDVLLSELSDIVLSLMDINSKF